VHDGGGPSAGGAIHVEAREDDGEGLAPVHGAELQRFAHELVGVGASHARIDLSQPAAAAANSLEMSVNVPIWTFASTGPTA
jgi:hypothetical protein